MGRNHSTLVQTWFRIALVNFFFAAVIGALLRWAFVYEIPYFHYRNFLHAHSHVAMLGWVFLGLVVCFLQIFELVKEGADPNLQKWLWGTELSVIGMLISFPIQGYGAVSIFFTSLNLICMYGLSLLLFKRLKNSPYYRTAGGLLLITTLGMLVLSSLGIWTMAVVMASGNEGTILYYICVQYFLHVQFNGVFLFGGLSLFVQYLYTHQIRISRKQFRIFYISLLLATILTFFLYLAWAFGGNIWFLINGVGVVLQALAIGFGLYLIRKDWNKIQAVFSGWHKGLLIAATSSLILKGLIQLLLVFPSLAVVGYTVRNFVIGFFHLLLLGLISTFVLAFAGRKEGGMMSFFRQQQVGLMLFLLGLILSEGLIFGQGISFWWAQGLLPFYYEGLFAVSCLMPLGILLILTAKDSA